MSLSVEAAAQIAHEAGTLLRNYFERRVQFELKGEYDLVTHVRRGAVE